jgi:hypothetical protein
LLGTVSALRVQLYALGTLSGAVLSLAWHSRDDPGETPVVVFHTVVTVGVADEWFSVYG